MDTQPINCRVGLSFRSCFKLLLLSFLLCFTAYAMAATHQPQTSKFPKCPKCSQPSEGHVSLSFGLGGGSYNDSVGNRDLKVTPFETDFLTAAHQSQHLYYLLSLHYFEPLQHNGWVSGFSVGPTVYYQPVHFSGEVYQFRQPILNNYTYRAKIHPINAYVEADLFLHTLFQAHPTGHRVAKGRSIEAKLLKRLHRQSFLLKRDPLFALLFLEAFHF